MDEGFFYICKYMSAILLHIHPDNPQERLINQIVDELRKGAIIIYPTDTIYGIGCDIYNSKAIDNLCRIKGVKAEKTSFAFICSDLSNISEYARSISTPTFKLMKRTLPGPFTFILNASSQVPKILQKKKKTIGIRIPNNNIVLKIVEKLGNPIITTSLKIDDDILEYPTDPELIYDEFKNQVDFVIDGGFGSVEPSTVVDCTNDEPEVIRQGAGEL